MIRRLCTIVGMLFAVALLLTGPAAHKAAAAQARTQALPRIVYGFDREFPPFSFEEAGGKAVGFEVELLEAILSGTANLMLRPMQWENVSLELSANTIQVASGMVQTAEREKLYLFPEKPTFSLQIRMFTKTYNRFPNLSFLRGQKVSVEQASYQHRLLERYSGFNIKTFKDKASPLKALYTDEVTAYCAPVQSAYYYMNKLGYSGITTMGTPLGITQLRYAVNRDRGDIVRLINAGFAKIVANGEYDRIYKKWFVRELTNEETSALINAAKSGVQAAYVPYSHKPTGAAVLAATGKIYYGAMVENADKNVSISALSAAVAAAVSAGDLELRAAVSLDKDASVVELAPGELQLLYEFDRGILALGRGANGTVTQKMVGELLPKPVTAKPAFSVQ